MTKRRARDAGATSKAKRAKTTLEVGGIETSQPQSTFFGKLNYDVRCVIYDCLYGHPPLLARKWHANGAMGILWISTCGSPLEALRMLLTRPFDKVTLLILCPQVEASDSTSNAAVDLSSDYGLIVGKIQESIKRHWAEFLDKDDDDKRTLYRERLELTMPHLPEDSYKCCHKCNDDCLSNNSSCGLLGNCKYDEDKDRTTMGPKRRDYVSDDARRFACLQWKRLSSSTRSSQPAASQERQEHGDDLICEGPSRERMQTKEFVVAWDYRRAPPFPGMLHGFNSRYTQNHVQRLALEDSLDVPLTNDAYDKEWPCEYYLIPSRSRT
ncbi:hypothetical protein BU23DRAFT_574086 [Bimuria novae-zelandiae CBS 107.79]|uniref:Uncharacterized protein n=1 Tax=Bimuria novae-zelandiae CBS 107.79 TaxID=1447943 RepID=A0A6A5UPM7_9PLEO|nr:hypothetical protein BU23DRAFT_574086 [Bimuria novae-zelandiae CBS 107.79]